MSMAGAKIRVMVVGIPNVGKINVYQQLRAQARRRAKSCRQARRYAGQAVVTVGNYDLLDAPGVLWKKFDSWRWRQPGLHRFHPKGRCSWTSRRWQRRCWVKCSGCIGAFGGALPPDRGGFRARRLRPARRSGPQRGMLMSGGVVNASARPLRWWMNSEAQSWAVFAGKAGGSMTEELWRVRRNTAPVRASCAAWTRRAAARCAARCAWLLLF